MRPSQYISEKALHRLVAGLRKKSGGSCKARDWREKDIIEGKCVESFVIVLPTKGCSWAKASGCTMCGYINDSCPTATDSLLISEFERAIRNLKGEKSIKIYTSGSFFDNNEVGESVRNYIYKAVRDKVERLVVESRPEFINENVAHEAQEFGSMMIALGLESASNDILKYSINKGFTVDEYIRAVGIVRRWAEIKTYVLLKPPFLSEKDAIEDCIKSAVFASKYSDIVSINPVNVQKGTLVEHLWIRGEYRPPWLWSVLKVFEMAGEEVEKNNARLISMPTSWGRERGAHNCGACDRYVVDRIHSLSFENADYTGIFDDIECQCRNTWEKIVKYSDFMYTSVDVQSMLACI